ncbi:N-acetylmuramoyl-L-alanine amidase family protein [Desulforamulus hydrothermalis]|uniref:N-acetylmuramoyl-L-alanine amidase n=1 Tax=Desulforamulus hydrothermalis Lam5 = DSM 18033 TaxID=1121428 RepID=K8EI40_9FIRM|nr:N-acetylmuramoyl-L-alanine amidase [Desulforamulus hydrothermalis]CCO08286.1 N-acetylmuramoyl-L-alanine amidase [Desulforamulus hydrothermalis Lam5 = DSM 18033]SHH37764.1 N-acetylmuramoyl-L-alanine amidase [Desulforamulus hydrothermalis Lam5 = DSM 18033]
MAKKIVCIDPGHGGGDPGAIGNGLQEKDINLDIAKRVAAKLLQYEDIEVKLTRDGDQNVSLHERVVMANRLNADFFLSIHVNAGGGTGFESFVYTGAGEHTRGLRTMIHAEIGKCLDAMDIFDRGPKLANFQVLRNTKMPAMLVECLFIDNPKDAALLRRDDILDGLAGAIVAGLVRAFSLVLKQPTWDPQAEVQKLINAGIINTSREHTTLVTWGEFATVLNRILNK